MLPRNGAGEADGDGLFFEILDAYAHLRQETPG